ncbi:MAG: NAD(P)H-hydrate epimerase [Candidatus Woesearchaeota archaeon]
MGFPSVTVDQMREIDRIMVEDYHVEVLQMMESAGRALANAAIKLFNPGAVSVLVGPGNNGGDGLAAARHLHNKGVKVEVVQGTDRLNENSLHQMLAIRALGLPVNSVIKENPDLVLDCLLGYNTKGAPRGRIADLIRQARQTSAEALCCDNPSGFDAEAGEWHHPAFEDAVVLTLALPKDTLLNNKRIKKLLAADIGVPAEAYEKLGIDVPALFRQDDIVDVE